MKPTRERPWEHLVPPQIRSPHGPRSIKIHEIAGSCHTLPVRPRHNTTSNWVGESTACRRQLRARAVKAEATRVHTDEVLAPIDNDDFLEHRCGNNPLRVRKRQFTIVNQDCSCREAVSRPVRPPANHNDTVVRARCTQQLPHHRCTKQAQTTHVNTHQPDPPNSHPHHLGWVAAVVCVATGDHPTACEKQRVMQWGGDAERRLPCRTTHTRQTLFATTVACVATVG